MARAYARSFSPQASHAVSLIVEANILKPSTFRKPINRREGRIVYDHNFQHRMLLPSRQAIPLLALGGHFRTSGSGRSRERAYEYAQYVCKEPSMQTPDAVERRAL